MTEIQTLTIETVDQPTVVEVATGPQGERGAQWHFGDSTLPSSGKPGDIYLVSEGTTSLGNVYSYSSGSWSLEGNIRGSGGLVNSVNGITAENVIIGAGDLTTGTLADSRLSSNVIISDKSQTITGEKTFTVAPVVPNNSFTISKTSGLQQALDSKASSSHSHNDLYYTKAEVDSTVSGAVKFNDVIMHTNIFGGNRLYITQLHNAAFSAHLRWVVTGKIYRSSDDVLVSTPANIGTLFNGEYESNLVVPAGHYIVISIKPDNSGGYFQGYPYGYFYLSHYYSNIPESVSARVYNNYASQGVGWHDMPVDRIKDGPTSVIARVRNDKYQVSEVEFTVRAPSGKSAHITQIDWNLDRASRNNELPYVDKFRENNLYHTLSFMSGGETTASIDPAGVGKFSGLVVGGANINALLDGKANASHTHTAASIGAATPAELAAANTANRARANHTGTQPASTITGLAAVALSGSAADLTGVLPASALPPLAVSDTFTVASQTAMLALSAQRGDIAIRTDNGRTYILTAEGAGTLSNWKELTPAGQVISVAGKSGAVTLVKADVGLGNVDNTSDLAKPISTAVQAALNTKAASGHSHAIGSLSDVNVANPQSGHVISYNGSEWVNAPVSAANFGAAPTNHSHDLNSSTITGILPISKIPTGTTSTTVARGNHTHEYSELGGKPDLGTAAFLDVPATGNASATQVVKGTDSRLTNARTPLAHTHTKAQISDFTHQHTKADISDFAHSHEIGQLPVAPDGAASVEWLVRSDDSRLSDARTPTSHAHAIGDITGLNTQLATKETPAGAQAKVDAGIIVARTYTDTKIADLVDASPATLNTLNELAAALGDDPNFATTVSNQIGTKEPLISAGTTAQYWRGDKTWQPLTKSTVGLSNVPNVDMRNLSNATSGTVPEAQLPSRISESQLDARYSKKLWPSDVGNVRTVRDIAQVMINKASVSQNIKIETSIPTDSAIMFKIRITAYNYQRGVVDGWLTAYMYNNNGGTIYMPRWVNRGDVSPTVRLFKGADNKLVIILQLDNWSYPRISIPEAQFGFGNWNTSYAEGWSIYEVDDFIGLTEAAMYSHHDFFEMINMKASSSHSHLIGDLPVATSGQSSNSLLVRADDARLSDARTPVAHNHTIANVTGLQSALDGKSAISHGHALTDSNITGVLPLAQLPTHTHSKSQITDFAHGHAIADVTGLQAALDAAGTSSHTHTLNELSNVTISSISANQMLRYDGTKWVNRTITAADVGASSTAHGHSLGDGNITGTLPVAQLPSHTHTKSQISDFAHGHTIADVTNLQSTLDGKAASGHGHALTDSNITGVLPLAQLPSHTHTKANITDFSHTHAIGDLPVASSGTSNSTQLVRADDARLSNARPPTAHSHTISDVSGLQTALDGKAIAGHQHTTILSQDVRNIPANTTSSQAYMPTPDEVSSTSASLYFSMDPMPSSSGIWRSAFTVKGWIGNYGAWQLIGPAHTSVDNNFFLRSGAGESWATPVKIWHSGNLDESTLVKTDDSRLTDARTPTAHNHPVTDLTATGTRSSSTYLRGDGTWATPTNTTYSLISQAEAELASSTTARLVSGQRLSQAVAAHAPVKSVAGKTGAVTVTASDVGAAPASHGHSLSDTNITGTLPLAQNTLPVNNNLIRSNLGNPTVAEMALIDASMTNKLLFKLPESIEYSVNGTTWLTHPTAPDSAQIKAMVTGSGDLSSGLQISNGWYGARMTFTKSASDFSGTYVYLNALYMYFSTNGHSVKVVVERSVDGVDWDVVSDTNNVGGWPGHAFLSHATIPWSINQTAGHYRHVRATFVPTWNAVYSNSVNIQRLEWWGGFPAQARGLMTWDFDKNVSFPADVKSAGQALVKDSDPRLTGNAPSNNPVFTGKITTPTIETTNLLGIDMGNSYGQQPAGSPDNIKISLYNTSGTQVTYGIGISSGRMEYQANQGTAGQHTFYVAGGTRVLNISSGTVQVDGTLTAGNLVGAGGSITAISASNVTSGTLPVAQLPSTVFHTGHLPTWSEVTEKPSTFTPSTHGHALTDANITGTLPLAQMPAHTHAKAQITDFAHTHAIGDLPVASSGTSNSTQLVRADDSRLSNARTPTAHTHLLSDLPDAWIKRSVRVATTGNITLSGLQTIDGVSLVAGDRVLVKDQNTSSQNGIYVVASGAWARAAGSNTSAELAGATVSIDQGSTQTGQMWTTGFSSSWTLGSASVVFHKVLDTSALAMDGGTVAGTLVQANDYRLSNPRTPTSHSHVMGDISGLNNAISSKADASHGHSLTDSNITGVLPIAQIPTTVFHTGHLPTWSEVSGKPTSFPPETHGHALTDSNITGVLPLAQMPAHTHTKAQISDFAHTHAIGDLPVASSGTSNSTQLVRADDSRLSDARTPTAHIHQMMDIDGLPNALTSLAHINHGHALTDSNITGVLPIAQIPTGTTSTTVALGNHLHTGVYEPAFSAGTTAQYRRGDKTWQTLNAAAVGLGNVNNTSDAAKPVSTATQNALNLKANAASPTLTGVVTLSGASAGTGSQKTLEFGNGHYTGTPGNANAIKILMHPSGYGFGVSPSRVEYHSTGLHTFYANGNQTMSIGADGSVTATSFHGSGVGLLSLNASNLSVGTVPQARLTPNIHREVFTSASHARPAGVETVEWVGPVRPLNATANDTWIDTSTPPPNPPEAYPGPVGAVTMFMGFEIPEGWLEMAGQEVPIATYTLLYNNLTSNGTVFPFGANTNGTGGAGSTHFRLPNFKGKMPVGQDAGQTDFNSVGKTGGQKRVTLTEAEMPNHRHTFDMRTNATGLGAFAVGYVNGTGTAGAAGTTWVGGGQSHENMPPFMVVRYIIKAVAA